METKLENGTLQITLSGRVDSTNAAAVGEEMLAACAAPHDALVIDAKELEYISSAGLRVILRLRKENPKMEIINVASEVYEVFDMTGFTEMLTIKKAWRELSVEGCHVLGAGAKGTVYRYDADTIVKVYKNQDSLPDIQRERELARRAFVLGVPTAISYDIVRVGEQFGSVFELLDAKPFSQLIAEEPDARDGYIEEYANLLRLIHSTEVKPDEMPDAREIVKKWLSTASSYLSDGVREKVVALCDGIPETNQMLHCDYHTNNVMSQKGETLLIDMDTLSHGHPIIELANVYITYVGFGEVDPPNVENFLGMPYSLAVYVWKKFLPVYLGTDDPARIAEVEQKVRLLSYLRLLRHLSRRGAADSETGREQIAYAVRMIEELAPKTDTLLF